MPAPTRRRTRRRPMSRSRWWNTETTSFVVAAIGALATIVGALSTTLFRPNETPPASSISDIRLYEWQRVGRQGAAGGPENTSNFLFVVGEQNRWVTAPGNSSARISFRQSAAVRVSAVPVAGLPRPVQDELARPTAISGATLPYKAGEMLCMEVAAGAFDISGQPRSCVLLTSGTMVPSWAWSLHPKGDVAGDQEVSIAVTIESANPSPNSLAGSSSSVVADRTNRSIVVTVDRGLLDKYPTLVVGFLTALATLVGIVIKGIADRLLARSNGDVPN